MLETIHIVMQLVLINNPRNLSCVVFFHVLARKFWQCDLLNVKNAWKRRAKTIKNLLFKKMKPAEHERKVLKRAFHDDFHYFCKFANHIILHLIFT